MSTNAIASTKRPALPLPAQPVGHVARGLLSVPFVVSGAMHFAAAESMAGVVPSWVPGGVLWVYLTGLALLAGGVGIHLRRWAAPAGVGLAALLIVFAVTVHLPAMGDAAMGQIAMVSFLKDLGLAGGALAVALLARARPADG